MGDGIVMLGEMFRVMVVVVRVGIRYFKRLDGFQLYFSGFNFRKKLNLVFFIEEIIEYLEVV